MADYREQSTDAAVKAGSAAAVAADQAMVVALSPNSPLPTGVNTIGSINVLDGDVMATGTVLVTDLVVAAPGGAGAFVTGASTATSYVFALAPGGDSAWNLQITGLTSGTLYFEESLDSTNGADGQWINVNGRQTGIVNTVLAGSATTNGMYRGNTSGAKYFRVRSVGAMVGTPAIVIRLSGGAGAVFLNASVPSGINSIGTVQQAALTKGAQGATGVTTQDLKDAGRVNVAMTCYQAAGIPITEALFAAAAFSISRDGAAATTGQQLAVTAGKRLRLQSVVVGIKNTAGAAGTSKLVLRYAAAGGAIAITSPILAILDMGSNATVANAYIGPTEMALPDGIELLPASTFGFTNLSSAVTMLHTITVNGYEY